jgi:hypothetical protein
MAERKEWEGTAGDLLDQLTPERPPRAWPKTPQGMGRAITKIAPGLRKVGIEVDHSREAGSGRRIWKLTKEDRP